MALRGPGNTQMRLLLGSTVLDAKVVPENRVEGMAVRLESLLGVFIGAPWLASRSSIKGFVEEYVAS